MKDTEGMILSKSGTRVLTPVARVIYTHLLAPQEYEGKIKYSLTLLFDRETDLTALQKAVFAAGATKFGKKIPNIKKIFKNGNDKFEETGNTAFKNKIFINPRSDDKPDVGKKINGIWVPITSPEEIYWGMYVRATLVAFTFEKKVNKGVSFALKNVIKVRDGERLGDDVTGDVDFKDVPDSELSYEEEGGDPSGQFFSSDSSELWHGDDESDEDDYFNQDSGKPSIYD